MTFHETFLYFLHNSYFFHETLGAHIECVDEHPIFAPFALRNVLFSMGAFAPISRSNMFSVKYTLTSLRVHKKRNILKIQTIYSDYTNKVYTH